MTLGGTRLWQHWPAKGAVLPQLASLSRAEFPAFASDSEAIQTEPQLGP